MQMQHLSTQAPDFKKRRHAAVQVKLTRSNPDPRKRATDCNLSVLMCFIYRQVRQQNNSFGLNRMEMWLAPIAVREGTDSVWARRWPPPPSAAPGRPAELAVASFRRTRHCQSGQAMPCQPRTTTGLDLNGSGGEKRDREQGC
jgi:hypothetical protein